MLLSSSLMDRIELREVSHSSIWESSIMYSCPSMQFEVAVQVLLSVKSPVGGKQPAGPVHNASQHTSTETKRIKACDISYYACSIEKVGLVN